MTQDTNPHILIQARMGSTRFPGKSLHIFKGRTGLEHLCDSLLQEFQENRIAILTSTLPKDDLIEESARKMGLRCHRGDESNVASRFLSYTKQYQPQSFLRLSGDSPLLCARSIRKALSSVGLTKGMVSSANHDFAFPSGNNFELLNTEFFQKHYERFSTSDHFEHVTKFFYEQGLVDDFVNFPTKYRNCKLSFDTKQDLDLITKIFEMLDGPHWEYDLATKCEHYLEVVSSKGNRNENRES